MTRLAEGEATVGELGAICRHPKVLERAGLTVRSQEARWRPSRRQADPLDEAGEWIGSRKRTWEARMDQGRAPAEAGWSAAFDAPATVVSA